MLKTQLDSQKSNEHLEELKEDSLSSSIESKNLENENLKVSTNPNSVLSNKTSSPMKNHNKSPPPKNSRTSVKGKGSEAASKKTKKVKMVPIELREYVIRQVDYLNQKFDRNFYILKSKIKNLNNDFISKSEETRDTLNSLNDQLSKKVSELALEHSKFLALDPLTQSSVPQLKAEIIEEIEKMGGIGKQRFTMSSLSSLQDPEEA